MAAVFVSSAGAYGGGATHDMWQVGISFNRQPILAAVLPPAGEPELGGFWGWIEFDRSGTQTWGDAQLTWHLGPARPNDPNFGTPGAQDFYVDGNVVTSNFHGTTTTTTDDPEFLGDSSVPAEPGHYAFHPAPGASGNIQVALGRRPKR